jgi:adenosylhomocysteine nucleosidase
VLFALRRESMIFRRTHRPLRRLAGPCNAAIAGQSFILVETGVGRAAIETAFDWLLTALPRPRWLLYAGFAGALDPALHIGDVLVADTVIDALGRSWSSAIPVHAWPGVQRGRLFTSDRLVGAPEHKRRLRAQFDARMVDMEAAHVAARCADAAIPFGCVRAISDTVDSSLSPALVDLLAGERVSAVRLARAIARSPALLPELCRLGRDTRIAAGQLARALDGFLTTKLEARQSGRDEQRHGGPCRS